MSTSFRIGVDIGSTTAKLALIDSMGRIKHADYCRHKGDIIGTLLSMLDSLQKIVGNIDLTPAFTGSAGMGLAERTGTFFVQEVVAASKAVQAQYPDCKMLIDIGGEDSKMIFFDHNNRPDIRMNGNCAGGTGAFIDQMASLMNISTAKLDLLAQKASRIHTIASRCGVFAKTDIQNLMNTGVSKTEIAASIFQAVAIQAVNSLARGHEIKGPAVWVGGPLHYYRSLRNSFLKVLALTQEESILPEASRVYPAYGAALTLDLSNARTQPLKEFYHILQQTASHVKLTAQHEKLFKDKKELEIWNQGNAGHQTPKAPLHTAAGKNIFLGIDAGSTTTKIVAVNESDEILFQHYQNNQGNPIKSVGQGLKKLKQKLDALEIPVKLKQSVVTGYGEELIRAAFEVDQGMVETLAHYHAAKKFDPQVSFILDIGGQDMKAITVQDGMIKDIKINEACSSGCGSFIETFADSLGYSAAKFGDLACTAKYPVDLGSRCTVFMNSSVKQALRQGNDVADVAAGLSYSVIQNCLHKVLRISDATDLGDRIVVQGGTFKNPAVLRAMEKLLGVTVIRPDIAEYMGAYGAAITARKNARNLTDTTLGEPPLFHHLTTSDEVKEKCITCKGCTNNCQVRILQFPNGRKYYTGNRCERIFTNKDTVVRPGDNLFEEKRKLLLNTPKSSVKAGAMTIGIPMALNFYENYPFWVTFFNEIGFNVVRSSLGDNDILTHSATTIMSDNICYPAKLMHAHILDLISRKVDRIFYPRVVFENTQFKDSANHFNCPVVTGYPDVINSAINPGNQGIPMDSPPINFHDKTLLKKACIDYARRFNVSRTRARRALVKAQKAMIHFREAIQTAGRQTIEKARTDKNFLIVLAGRPYHIDTAINHDIPDMISRMGIHVLTEDALPLDTIDLPETLEVADQWEYSNRLYRAAHWAGREPRAAFLQFNSFGCGPDAVVIDEVKAILKTYGQIPTVLKIDEIASIGSAKLRVRSLVESRIESSKPKPVGNRTKLPVFKKEDRRRKILVPDFSPFYTLFAQSAFIPMGYQVEILPPPDKESVRMGLKYVNNDMCYPAIVTIGDIIKAIKSGQYNLEETALALTETGGQCRATNYVSLLKKALLHAGYDNIPVVSISFNKHSANDQPGFSLNRPKVISLMFSGLLVVDQLIRMYHVTAVREVVKGESLMVLKKHLDTTRRHIGKWAVKRGDDLLKNAVCDFNRIKTHRGEYPKAGIVGEIFVKYNPFSNSNIVNQLMNEGIQVTMPLLITFFMQTFVNIPFNHAHHIERSNLLDRMGLSFVQRLVDIKIGQTNKIMSNFKFDLDPIQSAKELSQKAKSVINLANQAGEGWLLPGEVVTMADSGIQNIICLQPFGCIANHVVGKGISKKLASLYPDLNYLALDMDAGNSDANIQNRLAFFIHITKELVTNASSTKHTPMKPIGIKQATKHIHNAA